MIQLTDIRKRFRGVEALRGVDLALRGGETHALVGQNGAGKSTLVKVLGGALRPDAGALTVNGRRSPSTRRRTRCAPASRSSTRTATRSETCP